jgi:lipopolysaccharide/colanic/teichoic acid biosynthesis glycosyltransferase
MRETSVARRIKYGVERVVAAVAIVALGPLWLVIAVLVRLSSPGPIIHRRRVLGCDGRQFDAFKFRTMVADADHRLRQDPALRDAFVLQMKVRDDPRLTPLGRWLRRTSLDELPQLVNVVRGEMSLVGPRMISPEEADKYGAFLARRLGVKPGITGLWQVSGRQELSYEQRIELDIQYLDNWSLWRDLVILAQTIPAVLSMRGAH